MAKFELKNKTRALRQKGLSLKEICDELNIAKSTASEWCKGIILSKAQSNALEKRARSKNYLGALKGALANREKSEKVKRDEYDNAKKFIKSLTQREICLIGTALYWAEGHKTKSVFGIVNSDYKMILVAMKWLEIEFGIEIKDYIPRLFINSLYKNKKKEIVKYWSKQTLIPVSQFRNTIFITSKMKKIYNNSKEYNGVMHLRLRSSSKVMYRTLSQIECIKQQVLKNR